MKYIAFVAAFALTHCAGLALAGTCDSSPLMVLNTNVWTNGHLLERRDLLFRGGRVAEVTPAAKRRPRGVRTIDGSDAGSPVHFQAGAIWWDLEAWRALGASNREVLVAATDGGARVLRNPDVGRLAAGARADFVLYRGNVERGPFDASRIIAVAKGGVLYVADGKWTGY